MVTLDLQAKIAQRGTVQRLDCPGQHGSDSEKSYEPCGTGVEMFGVLETCVGNYMKLTVHMEFGTKPQSA